MLVQKFRDLNERRFEIIHLSKLRRPRIWHVLRIC